MSKGATINARGTEYSSFDAHQPVHRDQVSCSPLCSGPYQDFITGMAAMLPNLAGSDPRNKALSLEKRRATVKMIAFKKDSEPKVQDFQVAKDLKLHFDQRLQAAKTVPSNEPKRHIYILEGLNGEFIATLGEYFYMDPLFFIEQEVISRWNKNHSPPQLTEPLPSLVHHRSHFGFRGASSLSYLHMPQLPQLNRFTPIYEERFQKS
jgi:hypothetical protein